MEKNYNFYLLRSNKSVNDIRYIGVTTCSLKQRYYGHKFCVKKGKSLPVYNWWRKRTSKGYDIFIELLETSSVDWEEKEKYWIRHYRQMGFKLLNVSEGGAGIVTKELRDNDSIKRSSKKHQKAIIALTLNNEFVQEFESVTDASTKLHILKTSIGNVLHKRSQSAGGYRWIFKEEYNIQLPIYHRNGSIPVYCFDLYGKLQKQYYSMKNAKHLDHHDDTRIKEAIINKRKYHNLYWSFEDFIDVTQYK